MSTLTDAPFADFAEWLRVNREARRATQRDVAESAGLDLTLLCRLESGERIATEEQADALARLFKADPNEAHALRIAGQFRRKYADHPAAREAILRLAEEAGVYRVKRKGGR